MCPKTKISKTKISKTHQFNFETVFDCKFKIAKFLIFVSFLFFLVPLFVVQQNI